MRPVLGPFVDRRRLLALGAKLSIATFASTAIWPRSGASQSGLVEGYADGDGVRLYFVQGGEGQLMLFLHGLPDNWTLYTSQLAEFSRDHMVVAPNLRGFPPSDQPEAVEAYAARMEMPDLPAAFFADVAEPPATTSLRVDVPTLVLWGMQDHSLLSGLLDNLHDYAPNATVVRIEDAGHRPMQSHPMLVNRAIRDFLPRTHQ